MWTSDVHNYMGSHVLPKARLLPPHKAAYILFAFSGVSNSFHKLSTSWSFFSFRTCRRKTKQKTTQLYLKHFLTTFNPAFSREDLKQIYRVSNHWKLILIESTNSILVLSSFIILSQQLYPTKIHIILQCFYFQLHYRSCSIMAGSFWTCTLKQNPLLVYQNWACSTSSTGLIHNPSDPNLALLWENTNIPNRKERSHELFSLIWSSPRKKGNITIKKPFHPSLVISWAKNYLKRQQWLNPISVQRDPPQFLNSTRLTTTPLEPTHISQNAECTANS